mgnify:FL=1|tara:strand:- start:66 stop:248 length:183 start_codon:yes stop_codon:yes gene_type:complete
MNNIPKNSMRQARGGVLAQEDIELLKKTLEFYLKNNKSLNKLEESKISLLFHRLGRMSLK